MPRLWFNRAYATTWHQLAMIRSEVPDTWILGSQRDPHSPVLAACDEALLEPRADDEYVDWALAVAERFAIDLFVPREKLAAIAAAREQFAAVGTRLMCPDAATVELFEDKLAGYRAAAELGLPVPPHRLVRTAAELRDAYAEFAAIAEQVCLKPIRGVGGQGFRRLTDKPERWDEDYGGEARSLVRLDAVCGALDRDGPRDLLVLPFLDEHEVSVDVLAGPDGTVHAAIGRRYESNSRLRVIVDDPAAREIATTLVRTHRVAYLSNTQVRWWQGKPYLLELNTRAAGGLFQTALGGVNLPAAAIRLALGEAIEPIRPTFGARYTQLATAVPLGSEIRLDERT